MAVVFTQASCADANAICVTRQALSKQCYNYADPIRTIGLLTLAACLNHSLAVSRLDV